jgi:hypothetical protein
MTSRTDISETTVSPNDSSCTRVLSFTGYWRTLGVDGLQAKLDLAVSFLACPSTPSVRQYPVNDSICKSS